MDLVHISSGWANYLKGSEEVKRRMMSRLKVCDTCPNKQQVDKLTGRILKILGNGPSNMFRCALCKCPLGALSASPLNGCKGNKWVN